MRSTNYEDMIMKRAMDIFAEDGLKFFGIDKKVKDTGSTEIVVLEIKNMFMDYTFLMEDDTYIHFEFQTTNKGVTDLRRFRTYESLLNMQTGKDVVTYVVYSGDIKNPLSGYESGINSYRVNAISMANKDGDKIFNDIINKMKSGEELSKQDIIALTFTPIMGGKLSKGDKIVNAIRVVKDIDKDYRYDVESILYAFANKFLSGKDLEKVREEIKMTELGKSLIEEGIEKGIQKGIEKGREKGKSEGKLEKAIETAKIAIKKGMSNEVISELTDLSIEKIDIIRKAISNN
ncbi:hypothetical protein [Clostridium botulinum]|uniref:hypothetical protein n=1 Tax=Clostridium botulinum TaxID=1491 RepID=UPI0013F00D50|nr:hypothetical protein [Clostridium botulinum]MBN1078310.1 hypothetical protein [Clostridium botulinum]NFG59947.1 hypothetical protein [Clostridium botulinum]NFL34492.1 hypothetical protein [Clostridium botulinum]NFM04096.1 hypothetical protein [Clostridium botulinum]NFO28718.1 hypothetical protein [Clostridium botulinum]